MPEEDARGLTWKGRVFPLFANRMERAMRVKSLFVAPVLWAALFAVLFLPAASADWSFAILGDTRGNNSGTDSGVSPYLNTIAQRIATLNPTMVLVPGDLCSGDLAGTSYGDFMNEFNTWKTAMTPISSVGIPIYPVRGNHENEFMDFLPPNTDLKQAYYDSFGVSLPTNGPNNGAGDDQRGFTYSFTVNNVTVIAVDQYFYYDPASGYHRIDQNWLTDQLQSSSSPFKVVMAHEPVFMATGDDVGEHFFGTDAAGLQARSDFWNALGENGAPLYTCGHVHNLSVSSALDDFGHTGYQVTSGNGGAPPDDALIIHDPGVDVHYTNGTNFGFALATVTDSAMTINYHLYNAANDTWSVAGYQTVLGVPEPSTFALVVAGLMILAAPGKRARMRSAVDS
ncbi:MAG: metallophosphoesterase [Verrucomicrobia bacterium]|nr:metallophosphoesterase [Verrucomicrobiota bacterium]